MKKLFFKPFILVAVCLSALLTSCFKEELSDTDRH